MKRLSALIGLTLAMMPAPVMAQDANVWLDRWARLYCANRQDGYSVDYAYQRGEGDASGLMMLEHPKLRTDIKSMQAWYKKTTALIRQDKIIPLVNKYCPQYKFW